MKRLFKIILGSLAGLGLVTCAFVIFAWAPDKPVSALKARWAPAPSVFVKVANMDVHLRDEGPRGDAVPIILLHGTSSSLHTWEGWVSTLRTRRRVIRFDLPGFGLTGPSPDNVYTIDSYARFVTGVMDTLKVQRCVLTGNSFGGRVAWVTALKHPQRVKKLILVDASGYTLRPTSVPIGFRIARIPILNRLAANILPRSLIESSLQNVYGDPGKITPALIDRYFDITVREGNRRALVERFKQAPAGGLADRIGELKVPTLIMWGGRDRLIPLDAADRFHRDIADSQRVVFDDLGHVPQEEDPARTVAAIKQFLDMP